VLDISSNRGGVTLSRCLMATLAAVLASSLVAPQADARSDRAQQKTRSAAEAPKPLEADGPLLMLISLNQQRMFVYDANGLVVQTRVSTGMPGFDTPKGIYSILEKQREHASNNSDGASMPHMHRLLMTGIAMHGGVVPGYAASHGCVRLPFEFAR
jgi:lipoprotein-anchoring transpeptidase ErfK/SrfK